MAAPPGFVGPSSKRKLPGLAIDLGTLVLFIAALGLVQGSRYLTSGLINFMKRLIPDIPFVGDWATGKLESLNRLIRHWLGRAAAKCERKIAAAFRDLATALTDMVAELFAIAVALAALAWFATSKVSAAVRNAIATEVLKRIKLVPGKVRQVVVRETRTVVRQVRTVTRVVVRAGKVTTLHVTGTLPRWVRQLRRRVTKLERGTTTLRRRTTRLERRFALTPFAALTRQALRRKLGLDWLFCRNVNRLGREVCKNGGGWLDDLLLGLLPVLALTDLCALHRLAIEAGQAIAGPLEDLVVVADAALGCSSLGRPPDLPINGVQLPAAELALALA